MRYNPITTEEIVEALKNGPLTMFQLAEKMDCLTEPQPNDKITIAAWLAVGSHKVYLGRNEKNKYIFSLEPIK